MEKKRLLEKIEIELPLSEKVAERIRNAILDNTIKGGQKISVREISQMLNVSTTPVKEAFKMLRVEGLITTVPRSGTIVSRFYKNQMETTAFIRSSLEGVAANFAARMLSDDDMEDLEQVLEKAKKAIDEEDLETVALLNTEFHELIREGSGSDYLKQQIHTLRSFDITFRKTALATKEEMVAGYHEHVALLKALQNRDSELAEKILVNHIRRSSRFVLEKEQ